MRYHCTPGVMAIIYKKIITSVGKEIEKLERSHTAGRDVKWYQTLANSLPVPQKRAAMWPSNATSEHMLGKSETCPHKKSHTNIHRRITHNSRENPNSHQPITQVKKMWYIHTMECYWSRTRNEILIRMINLENCLMLRKEADHKSPHIIWFHLCEIVKTGKSMQPERFMIGSDWGDEGRGWCWKVIARGYRVSFGGE